MKTAAGYMVLLFSLVLTSCYYTQATTPGAGKPEWFWRPSAGDKVGGVGIAGPHINGVSAQRELAVQRAIDDIGRQLGVTVSTISKVASTGSKQGVQTQMASYSIQTVSGKTVRAKIMEFWEDSETGKLYVWMVVE